MRLSVVMITKNVANLLPDSIASIIDWVDEIVILDSGSDDNTVEIARSAGIKVFINSDWMGYGIQRQFAQRFATGDYILMMDADERVTSKLRCSIQSVLAKPEPGTVYSVSRQNYFLGYFMRYSGWYPDRTTRLYERKRYQYNSNRVHESLSFDDAKIVALSGDLLHFTCRNFANFQCKQLNHAVAWAKDYHRRGKKISITGIFIRFISTFLKTLLLRGGVLDGKRGWLLAVINAQYTFNKYTELWALNHGYSE